MWAVQLFFRNENLFIVRSKFRHWALVWMLFINKYCSQSWYRYTSIEFTSRGFWVTTNGIEWLFNLRQYANEISASALCSHSRMRLCVLVHSGVMRLCTKWHANDIQNVMTAKQMKRIRTHLKAPGFANLIHSNASCFASNADLELYHFAAIFVRATCNA